MARHCARRWGGRGKRTKVRKEGFILGGGGQEGVTARLGGAQGAVAVAGPWTQRTSQRSDARAVPVLESSLLGRVGRTASQAGREQGCASDGAETWWPHTTLIEAPRSCERVFSAGVYSDWLALCAHQPLDIFNISPAYKDAIIFT